MNYVHFSGFCLASTISAAGLALLGVAGWFHSAFSEAHPGDAGNRKFRFKQPDSRHAAIEQQEQNYVQLNPSAKHALNASNYDWLYNYKVDQEGYHANPEQTHEPPFVERLASSQRFWGRSQL